jgi:hypothetical protein
VRFSFATHPPPLGSRPDIWTNRCVASEGLSGAGYTPSYTHSLVRRRTPQTACV